MKARARSAWVTFLYAGFVWGWAACTFPAFPVPVDGPPGIGSPTNSPNIAASFNLITTYLMDLINTVATTKVYDVFVDPTDGVTYHARTGDVDDVVASSTDIGALVNTLWAGGGGVAVRLKTMATYNQATPMIAPSNNVRLFGMGPGTVVKATGSWTTGSSHAAGSFMFDCYNAGAGRKWVMCQDVWFDCNNLAEGGARYCGLVSDTTQWNVFFRNFVANQRVVGIQIEDQSVTGGTRQHIDFNKVGPGTSGVPTRGIEVRCNDIHMNENDVLGVSDIGIYISKRGAAADKGVGSWFISGGHVAVGNYQGGGISPDSQPINVFVDCTVSSGELSRIYVDNIKRHGVYFKPIGGHQRAIDVRDCWFNGRSLVEASGSETGCALVLDQSAGGEIYGVQFIGNRAGSGKTGSNPTQGVFYAMISLRGGMVTGNNYCAIAHNVFAGARYFWDRNGARPDLVAPDNWLQSSGQNLGDGRYSGSQGLWTTLTNILSNPTLGNDFNADNIPDGWVNQNIGAAGSSASYVSGVWQLVATSINQLIYQNVPCVAGKAYSVAFDASVVAGGGSAGAKLAILFLDETMTQVGAGSSTSGPTGTGGFSNIAVNNKTAPADDGHSGGTVDTVSGTAAIVAKTGTFANDLVNPFVIQGAGVAGADLVTTIATFTDSTHVTLTVAPSATITDANWIHYGHGAAVYFQVSLKNVSPNNTIQWKNGVVAQAATTTGQSGANAVGTVNTTAGTAAIVAATGTFPNDLVRPIVIAGAGLNGADLVTYITTFTNGTHVTLRDAPLTTVSAAVWAMAWYIPHGLGFTPSFYQLSPTNGVGADAMGDATWSLHADALYLIAATKSCTGPSFAFEALL